MTQANSREDRELKLGRKKEAMQKPHTLYLVSKKTGKVSKEVSTRLGKAQLVMWALTNTPPSKNSVIFETDTDQITDIIEGSKDFPNIRKDIYEEELYIERTKA